MIIKRTLQLNLAWVFLMWCVFLYLFIGLPSGPRAVYLVSLSAFVVTAIYALLGKPWALLTSMGAAFFLLMYWLPTTLVNFWFFLVGDPLYLDSPGTMLVVAVNAILFVIPATTLLVLFALQRRQVKALLLLRAQEINA